MKKNLQKRYRTDFIATEGSTKQWHFTGHFYYLLDTLKLSYSSQAGLVTYESISEESLGSLCRELSRGNWTQPNKIENVPALFTLSVCAVTWEKLHGQMRVKAIPDAAALRFEDIDYQASEAKFQSPFRKTDDAVTPMADIGGFDKEIKRVRNITTEEFLQILRENNQTVPIELRQSINVTAKNFEYRFTDAEQCLLTKLANEIVD
ncbi:hypothetical protein [Vibrio fluminensis]|uniref:hypothetical protein n=1 Tax=Vibrio fluminensis TaxID=2783614 RepID=UPI00188878B8|nr:hypothetical protein [Vibrio fluminensis]